MSVAMPVADCIQAKPSSTRKLYVMPMNHNVSARQAADLQDMFQRAVECEGKPCDDSEGYRDLPGDP